MRIRQGQRPDAARSSSRDREALKNRNGEMNCRVIQRKGGGRKPGRPDWSRIPTRRKSALTEYEWEKRIREQAFMDARHGRAFSGQAEKLLVEYLSAVSPDRRYMYEFFFAQYGDRLDGYRAGDGSNLYNQDGVWECEPTRAEVFRFERFIAVYHPAYRRAGAAVRGGRMFQKV